jgi:hypothetical protein
MLVVVLPHVLELETFRRIVVELNSAELPLPSDGVGDVEVDLGSVESAVPGFELIWLSCRFQCRAQSGLGGVPQLVGANSDLGTSREFHGRLESEGRVVVEDKPHEEVHFLGDLLLREKYVAVVLLELANAGETRQRARELVAMQDVERDVSQW